MIMVGRSLVCGSRGGPPSPVPRRRAGGLSERRHERAGAERGASRRRRRRCGSRWSWGAAASSGSSPSSSGSPSCAGALPCCSARPPPTWPSPARPPTASTPSFTPSTSAPATRSSRATRSTRVCWGRSPPHATRRDVSVRVVPFEELPQAVRPETRLVVTSHVSWATGRVMDTAPLAASHALLAARRRAGPWRGPGRRDRARLRLLRRLRAEVALRPRRHRLPVRSPELVPDLPAPWSGYHALEDPERGLEPALWPDARRLTTGFPVPHHVEWAHARLTCSRRPDSGRCYERGFTGAGRLAQLLSRERREGRSARLLHAGLVPGAGPARRSSRPRRPRAS